MRPKQKPKAKIHPASRSDNSDEFKPVTWRGRDLSTDTAILYYRGRANSRPIGRGVVLNELDFEPQLDEILDPGCYEIEIRVIRRLSANLVSANRKNKEREVCRRMKKAIDVQIGDYLKYRKLVAHIDDEIYKAGRELFTTDLALALWLCEPARALEGKVPLQAMRTKAGRLQVLQILQAIGYGAYL